MLSIPVAATVVAVLSSWLVEAAPAGTSNPLVSTKETSSAVYVAEPSWVAPLFASVNASLSKQPPRWPPPMQRQEALMLLDGPLHLVQANRFESTHAFLVQRVSDAIGQMENTRVTTGIMVWKIYNHGFVVRTPTVTVGMDVSSGWYAPGIPHRIGLPPQLIARLVRQLDLLSISHEHGDHADPAVVDAAVKAGVPVLAEKSVQAVLKPNPMLLNASRLENGRWSDHTTAPPWQSVNGRNGNSIDYIGYPGHQQETTNTVFLFRSPEHITFLHTGDESSLEDWGWLDKVSSHYRVDILFVNCWTDDLQRVVAGVKPAMVFTGHENEMGHTPDHREAYWRDFQRFIAMPGQPWCALCWGEGTAWPQSPSD